MLGFDQNLLKITIEKTAIIQVPPPHFSFHFEKNQIVGLVLGVALIGSARADVNYCAKLKAICSNQGTCELTSDKVSVI